jgi:hypothetical protein
MCRYAQSFIGNETETGTYKATRKLEASVGLQWYNKIFIERSNIISNYISKAMYDVKMHIKKKV